MRTWLLVMALLTLGLPLRAAEPCVTLESKAVAALFDEWNFALSSLEPSQVVQRYWPNAVLLPTVSNTPRTSPAMITDYFEHFLARRPRGRIDSRTVHSGCNVAMDMGTYTFSLMSDTGVTTEVAARYTFVYQYRDGAWKILHHHSSAMPEIAPGAAAADHHSDQASAPEHASAAEPAPKETRRERRDKRASVSRTPEVAAASPVKEKAAPETESPPGSKPESRTAMFVNLTVSPSPSKFYPPEAARRKERGIVNLKVCADGQGAVTGTMEVLKSSGSKLLDDAAMSWARDATWVPATLNNRRVEGCTKVDVAFEAVPESARAHT